MRKFILVAGFVLASAAAQAGDRSLSLSGGDVLAAPAKAAAAPQIAEAPQNADVPKAEAPKYIERPAVVEPKAQPTRTEAPKFEPTTDEPATPVVRKTASAPKAEGPRRDWNEARIIHELHRHGIYW